MDKNAIKKYAVWARNELIARVTQKALQYGITEENIVDTAADNIGGKLLTDTEKKQRQALIAQIKEKGFEQVIEEVAYTWFNRFSALRFMEVNGYLPTHVRVFTDEENNFKPQIITEAIHLEMDGLDIEKVYAFKEADKTEELYKYQLITQCNALNKILPGMFQRISDYTELLLPDNLLREGSVIEQMITLIPEDDWKDAVQIIGWLYQFYNIEPKAKVFNRASGIKINKEEISAATQLFTPEWIVRYMVENSLGRLWLEGHPNENLKSEWKYYLDEAVQETGVQIQLDAFRAEYKDIKPEDIRCIDPCMGSGHILVYMFDVLVRIYENYGYTTREAVASIIKNNIWGLDIDERAAQLSYFSVMMKARQYDHLFFNKKDGNGNIAIPQPHIYAIKESGHTDKDGRRKYEFTKDMLDYFSNGDDLLKHDINTLVDDLFDAKEYGSILNIHNVDFDALYSRFEEIEIDVNMYSYPVMNDLLPFVQVAQVMAQEYEIVITNPPYLVVSNANAKLYDFVNKNYPDSKADLFAVFIERCNKMLSKNGIQSMITMHSWMFLASFEQLRNKLLGQTIVNMIHLGARAFEEIGGEVVQTTGFTIAKKRIPNYKGTYSRLVSPRTQDEKEEMFLKMIHNNYTALQENYTKIPGTPIAYWWSDSVYDCFNENKYIPGNPMKGIQTGKGEKFLRIWHEVDIKNIGFSMRNHVDMVASGLRWFPLTSGGLSRRWYGNYEMVVNLKDDGADIRATGLKNFRLKDPQYYFLEGLTWTEVTTKPFTCRYLPSNILFGNGGPVAFQLGESLLYTIGLLNSVVAKELFAVLAPTMNYGPDQVRNVPFRIENKERCELLVKENIQYAKADWDSFETSWDFRYHPLVLLPQQKQEAEESQFVKSRMEKLRSLQWHYEKWQQECDARFNQLKANEEDLNRIFIDIYGLQGELTPKVEDKVDTVRKAELTRDIKSFISYAVGCMFGRYSLDSEGLAYAGGEWDDSKYHTFPADRDNIIPICDDEYFEDDIAGRFIKFVEAVYGKETLDENIKFIADALVGKGSPKDVIRNYFLNDFYNDHVKMYQKRPIYWQFDSGKKNGFKCLIYMHRYREDTIARIRTDYVHEQQSRYRTAVVDLEQRINSASTSDRVKLNKQLIKLKEQETEIRIYEEKIHHLADQMIRIDLDDGVNYNYEIFKDVLAKIK